MIKIILASLLLSSAALAQDAASRLISTGVNATMTASAPTAGTFSTILAASAGRQGCVIQNNSASVGFIFFGLNANATLLNSFQVVAGGGNLPCNIGGAALTNNVSATCASGTCAFVTANW